MLVNQTNYTAFVLKNVTPGTYLFTILAVNILGGGTEDGTSITVLFDGKVTKYTVLLVWFACQEVTRFCEFGSRRKVLLPVFYICVL